MTTLLFLATAFAGGIGAGLRFLVDSWVRARLTGTYPWGTAVINISGSFLLGLFTGLAAAHALSAPWLALLGTGVMGGYTTFSTASVETVRLLLLRRYRAALSNGIGMIAACVAAALLGVIIGEV